MLALNFINIEIPPCLFFKNIVILAIYVDGINIFGTVKLIAHTIQTLKGVFIMKDIGNIPNYCSDTQFKYLPNGILINQSTYTKKILKQFNMQNAHPVSTPMELRYIP